MRLATLWGCSVAEVDERLPASELSLWRAWQYIEPFGWSALDVSRARLSQMMVATAGAKNVPALADCITPDPDWRAFSPELHEEMEADRLVRNMKSVMRGGPDAK